MLRVSFLLLFESVWDHSGIMWGSFSKTHFLDFARRRAENMFSRAPGPGPSRPGMEYPVQGNPSLR